MNAAAYVLEGGLSLGGARTAIETVQQRISYDHLVRRVGGHVATFRAAGLRRGQRVALLADDTPALLALILGVIASGGVAVPLSTRLSPEDLVHALRTADPFALVTDETCEHLGATAFNAALGQGRIWRIDQDMGPADVQTSATEVIATFEPMDPTEAALWLMTSGTTGRPTAVEHCHANIEHCDRHLRETLQVAGDFRVLSTSRLNFAYALGAALGVLRLGGGVLLHGPWPTASSVVEMIVRLGPTVVFSVPALYRKVLETGAVGRAELRAVHRWVSAGERLPASLFEAWRDANGGVILDGMGCSESLYMLLSNAPDACRPGSSGRAQPGIEARLISSNGAQVVQKGEVGALHVKAPFLCRGYRLHPNGELWRPPARFIDDWFCTGDDYRQDADGFFHHCGRSDDMLRAAGLWVAPSEIEDVLTRALEIADAAAVQVLGESGLCEIMVFLTPAAGVAAELAATVARRQLESSLPSSKRPRRFEVMTELPRTATGKVQRHKLRQAAQAIQRDEMGANVAG